MSRRLRFVIGGLGILECGVEAAGRVGGIITEGICRGLELRGQPPMDENSSVECGMILSVGELSSLGYKIRKSSRPYRR